MHNWINYLMNYGSVFDNQRINLNIKDNLVTPLLQEILIPFQINHLVVLDLLKKLTVL
jgi:hypothetical protein